MLWRSNWFETKRQIAQLVVHLSGFNPSLVCHYFCHHIRVLIQIWFSSQFDVREDEEQNVKLGQTIDLLLAAGYFRARIKGLSPFDKVCNNVLQHNDIYSFMYIIHVHVPVIRDCMSISEGFAVSLMSLAQGNSPIQTLQKLFPFATKVPRENPNSFLL